ncbi:MAG: hypothetical protein KKG14_12150 [Alphaproteobacteria bacterium]|nr:hypothetical protein [Alphaproteobacteria bacterium]MBU2272327.1 hypothetical protein [Alphaproteobacteria bacterium]MBU2419444.1 hypothetical protein [Alphaproteobacteria bacterium]
MNRLTLAAVSLLALGAAACSDREDDVAMRPEPGAAPVAVSEQTAEAATGAAALAFGMTREQLEDADLMSLNNTDLGDVETLVLDANGTLTHVVVELEGPGDLMKVVPLANLGVGEQVDGSAIDLTTDLTAAQLTALPDWTPPAQ